MLKAFLSADDKSSRHSTLGRLYGPHALYWLGDVRVADPGTKPRTKHQ